jgi:hypothetical protein
MSLKIPKILLTMPVLCQICRFFYEKIFVYGARGRFCRVFNSLDEAREWIGPEKPSNYGDIDLTEGNCSHPTSVSAPGVVFASANWIATSGFTP